MVHPRSSSLSSSTCYPCSHQNLKQRKAPLTYGYLYFPKHVPQTVNSKYVVINVGLMYGILQTGPLSLAGRDPICCLYCKYMQKKVAYVVR